MRNSQTTRIFHPCQFVVCINENWHRDGEECVGPEIGSVQVVVSSRENHVHLAGWNGHWAAAGFRGVTAREYDILATCSEIGYGAAKWSKSGMEFQE